MPLRGKWHPREAPEPCLTWDGLLRSFRKRHFAGICCLGESAESHYAGIGWFPLPENPHDAEWMFADASLDLISREMDLFGRSFGSHSTGGRFWAESAEGDSREVELFPRSLGDDSREVELFPRSLGR